MRRGRRLRRAKRGRRLRRAEVVQVVLRLRLRRSVRSCGLRRGSPRRRRHGRLRRKPSPLPRTRRPPQPPSGAPPRAASSRPHCAAPTPPSPRAAPRPRRRAAPPPPPRAAPPPRVRERRPPPPRACAPPPSRAAAPQPRPPHGAPPPPSPAPAFAGLGLWRSGLRLRLRRVFGDCGLLLLLGGAAAHEDNVRCGERESALSEQFSWQSRARPLRCRSRRVVVSAVKKALSNSQNASSPRCSSVPLVPRVLKVATRCAAAGTQRRAAGCRPSRERSKTRCENISETLPAGARTWQHPRTTACPKSWLEPLNVAGWPLRLEPACGAPPDCRAWQAVLNQRPPSESRCASDDDCGAPHGACVTATGRCRCK